MKFILELLTKLGFLSPKVETIQPPVIIKQKDIVMKINEEGLNLVKSFEGCELKAYKDIVGILTIGYGHTGTDVKEGMTITQSEAEEILKKDLENFEKGVSDCIQKALIVLNENQFSALICFSYNVGLEALKTSTLFKCLTTKEFDKAADQFLRWNKAGGKEVAGLTRRREAERQLFLKS